MKLRSFISILSSRHRLSHKGSSGCAYKMIKGRAIEPLTPGGKMHLRVDSSQYKASINCQESK